jgi:hypothetical protein
MCQVCCISDENCHIAVVRVKKSPPLSDDEVAVEVEDEHILITFNVYSNVEMSDDDVAVEMEVA